MSGLEDIRREWEEQRRHDERMSHFITAGIMVATLIVVMVIRLIWSINVHGNYRCAFTQCVIVQQMPAPRGAATVSSRPPVPPVLAAAPTPVVTLALPAETARASRSVRLQPAPAPSGSPARSAQPAPPVRAVRAHPRAGGRTAMWLRLMACEAPDRGWRYGAPGVGADPGYEQYEGAFNWLHSTWIAHGGGKYALHAYDATPAEQIAVAEETLRTEGVRAWPTCGPRTGLHR